MANYLQMDQRHLSVKLFGQKYDTPLIVAPMGGQSLFHEHKESGVAEVCAEIGVTYTLSMASSSTMEEVAHASKAGKDGSRSIC